MFEPKNIALTEPKREEKISNKSAEDAIFINNLVTKVMIYG